MNNMIRSEFYKLFKGKSIWLVLIGLVVVSVAVPTLGSRVPGTKITGISMFQVSFNVNSYIIKFIPAFISAFFISSDFSCGVMKTIVSSGNSRSKIYASKLIVLTIPSCVIAILLPSISGAVAFIINGGGSLPDVSMVNYVLRTILLTSLYGAAYASIIVLFAMIFTDSGKSIAFLFFFFVFINIIFMLLGKLHPLFITLYNNSIFYLVNGTAMLKLTNFDLMRFIIVPIMTYAVAGSLGSMIFSRKEIK